MIDVRTLQSWLKKKQLYAGDLDGELGPQSWAAIHKVTASLPHNTDWNRDRERVAAEQMFLEAVGFDVGEIDGYIGVKTQAAFERWVGAVREHDAADPIPAKPVGPLFVPVAPAEPKASIKNVWPTQSGVPAFYGEVGQHQRMTVVPYTLFYDKTPLNKISLHEKVSDSAVRVLAKALKIYGPDRIASLGLNKYSGSLNVRKMRGGSAWSMHSWGIAIDFDAGNNPLEWDHTRARFAKPEYVQWWQCWDEEGWLSLGRSRDFDWMHVQAARL